MKLTENFTTEELSVTETGIYNTPGDRELDKLLYLATYILQPIRNKFGTIKINSGFRSEAVNKKIGGASTSQHQKGEAADIFPLQATIDEVFEWCKKNLRFGQLINEEKGGAKWIHVSLPRNGGVNQQVMTYQNGVYKNV